jgi:hypothetical protein
MSATKIMLIRHAEKPTPDGSIKGVTIAGAEDDKELSVRGWQRAGALVRFFAPANDVFSHQALAKPEFLFAPKIGSPSKSVRSLRTLQPLAEFLQKDIIQDHPEGGEAELAGAAIASSGHVLIAWEHKALPLIARAITRDATITPGHWPEHRFDLVWVLDRRGENWAFTQVPQFLLAGDGADVID